MSRAALPVTVIGGYLGAGKTTVVNHLLRHAGGRRIAVLVNEFGALPIDADLIEAEGDDLIAIAGGCICCSFGNDLIGALGEMAALSPPPDHVVVESSGVAIPGAIMASVGLMEGVRAEAIVVVADAETLRNSARDEYLGDTILRQLRDADIVVLNKCDLVTDGADAVSAWLGDMAPDAAVMRTQAGQVAPMAVLGTGMGSTRAPSGQHADALFASTVIALDGAVGRDTVEVLAQSLAQIPGIVRAKGYLGRADAMFLLQVVGQRWRVEEATGGDATTGVVCIGPKGQFDTATLTGLAGVRLVV